MIECFMVVSDEPEGERNWQRLLDVMPSAKRIGDAGGIYKSYRECANRCREEQFFVVDGDNWIVDDFKFQWQFRPRPGNVFVWRALNPVNDLVYGHGAIKLFCVADWIEEPPAAGIDITMGLNCRYQIVNVLASEHRFNMSPFHTWRTAFREAVKLATYPPDKPGADAAIARLEAWISKGADRSYGKWCVLGAEQGAVFGRQNIDNFQELRKVNDYAWLRSVFQAFRNI
jgi:hypothetical protein